LSKVSAYLGSKAASGLFQAIIAMMPPHETYIETHLGGGAIMKRKPAAMTNIGIDLDPKPLREFTCSYPVQLIQSCAHDFLQQHPFTGKELVYCDPPYLAETRTSHNRYRCDYRQQDHVALLAILNTLPCQVMISGYPSRLYDDYLGHWHHLELQAMSRGGPRTEKLWYNFELDRVHWARFAGKDAGDRQRIKRKAQRWQQKYQVLPPSERLAILAALMETEAVQ